MTIIQLDQQIQQLQQQLAALQLQRDKLVADIAAANALRPAGIPSNWKPKWDGSGATLRVYAWNDPNKTGE